MNTGLPNGIYDLLCTLELQEALSQIDDNSFQITKERLNAEDSALRLTQYVMPLILKSLDSITGTDKITKQTQLVEKFLEIFDAKQNDFDPKESLLEKPPTVLRSISPKLKASPVHPDIPLSRTDLLVNGSNDRSLGVQLRKEILSADRIDLLCSFLKWSGFRIIRSSLESFLGEGKQLRVLTTTYMGATEERVIEELLKMGAEVKISYDSTKTRLHAKTWYLHRNTGFSTCFLGSSNLSKAALLDGVEWNVRLSVCDNAGLVQKIAATFEQYWMSTDFEMYSKEHFRQHQPNDSSYLPNIEIRPRAYQKDILASLEQERELGFQKNLVVAATGTGKTMVAAFDFRNLFEEKKVKTLLFLAHRQEILKQARATYRIVLQKNDFGEVLWNNHIPQDWSVVFASVQSLKNQRNDLPKEHFDMIVVDESHHSSAGTYTNILEHFSPKYLLGLTATPERMDGKSILPFFDNRIAFEMRLWDALDQEILCPFQYFMSSVEHLDLRGVRWQNGRYNTQELENVYTGNELLVHQIINEIKRVILDPTRMCALAFCVNIAHAEFMANQLNTYGIRSVALTSQSKDRVFALHRLKSGEIQCICCVDIFNEGVDIPSVDTVLFLRPTQSQTIFLQQLGRGLRRSSKKSCVTVLDFVGQVHEKFQFIPMFRGLVGGSTASLRKQIELDFPKLPSGCSIILDRVSKETVLSSLQVAGNIRGFGKELKAMGDCSLSSFLKELDISVEDFYYSRSISFTNIRERVGFIVERKYYDERKRFERALYRSVYLNNLQMLSVLKELLQQEKPPSEWNDGTLLWSGLALGLGDVPVEQWSLSLALFWNDVHLRSEWQEFVDILLSRARAQKSLGAAKQHLYVSAKYSRQDVMALFGLTESTSRKIKNIREGVYYVKEQKLDLFFVTLRKTSEHFSVSTMYHDYPISPELFHWQSQSNTHAGTPVGKRYTQIRNDGDHSAVLFVREGKTDECGRTQAFTCLGPCTYVRHEGGSPMSITWKLEHPIPFRDFQTMKTAAG